MAARIGRTGRRDALAVIDLTSNSAKVVAGFRSDLSDDYEQYGMPELVGDVVKDAQQFKATSPLAQAARIRQPLLLAYGGSDHRVPIYHGRKFYDAVKATNPNVDMVVNEEEGHGWALPKNRIDFWTRVEKFLDKNIGKP